jgi:hypothetical protein
MQCACENNESTHERDTVRRLHYCISLTHHVPSHNNEFRVEIETFAPCIICASTFIVCFTCIILNLKSSTPSKYFAIVDLQIIFRRHL